MEPRIQGAAIPAHQDRRTSKTAYIFTAKSISLSKRSGRKPCDLLTAAKHNCRELKAEVGNYGHIDPSLTHLNEYLIGPSTSLGIAFQAQDDSSISHRNGKILRHDHTQAIELLFTLSPDNSLDVREFFVTCVSWARKAFVGHHIYSAIIHYDEGPAHCHVLISPIRHGVRVGCEVISRSALGRLKDKFWCEVAAPYGLSMPVPKLHGKRKREAVQWVKAYLERESLPCVKSKLWEVIEMAINRDPSKAITCLTRHMDEAHLEQNLSCVGFPFIQPDSQPILGTVQGDLGTAKLSGFNACGAGR
jgi:Plasmid recombination enzyme